MKGKDIAALAVAGVIITVVGVLLVGRFSGSKSHQAEVEVVEAFEPGFDESAQSQLMGNTSIRDFTVPVDLGSGLGNTNPFGQ